MKTRHLMLLLFLVLPLAGQETSPPWAEERAETLWRELQSLGWDYTYDQWMPTQPEARCVRYRGARGGAWRADDQWCYRCTRESKTHLAEWSFYVFAFPQARSEPAQESRGSAVGILTGQLTFRLEQYRAHAVGLSVTPLVEVHRALSRRLTFSYGQPEEAKESGLLRLRDFGLSEFGAASWSNIQRWRAQDREIVLYVDERREKQPRLGLLARHRHLLDAKVEDQRLNAVRYAAFQRAGSPLDKRLAEELRAAFPALTALLAEDKPSEDQRRIPPVLLRLLEQAKGAPTERRVVMLLAADRLASRLWHEVEPTPEWNRLREQLSMYGLSYEPVHLAGAWVYRNDLLWHIWEEYGETEWGEQAFVLLLNRGWDRTLACGSGSDRFREVIKQGEMFLAQRPQSRHRLPIVFALAQAYETWFSLSQALECKGPYDHTPRCDPYVKTAKYQEGSNTAAQNAAEYYREVMQLAPGSDLAAYARRRLPRLELRIDTNQRRFYCVYD